MRYRPQSQLNAKPRETDIRIKTSSCFEYLHVVQGADELALEAVQGRLEPLAVLDNLLGLAEISEVRNVGADLHAVYGDVVSRLEFQAAYLACTFQQLEFLITLGLLLGSEADAINLCGDGFELGIRCPDAHRSAGEPRVGV